MRQKFNEYNSFNLSDINREVLAKWNADNLFEQSMKVREGNPSFCLHGRIHMDYR